MCIKKEAELYCKCTHSGAVQDRVMLEKFWDSGDMTHTDLGLAAWLMDHDANCAFRRIHVCARLNDAVKIT